jgi:hypothetical protein
MLNGKGFEMDLIHALPHHIGRCPIETEENQESCSLAVRKEGNFEENNLTEIASTDPVREPVLLHRTWYRIEKQTSSHTPTDSRGRAVPDNQSVHSGLCVNRRACALFTTARD